MENAGAFPAVCLPNEETFPLNRRQRKIMVLKGGGDGKDKFCC